MTTFYAPQFPMYQPAIRLITNITQAFPAVVTTSFAHQYLDGQIVRMVIPREYIMDAIDGLEGTIAIIDSTSFAIDLDTRSLPAFYNDPAATQPAQSVPVGEITETLLAAQRNVLPYP